MLVSLPRRIPCPYLLDWGVALPFQIAEPSHQLGLTRLSTASVVTESDQTQTPLLRLAPTNIPKFSVIMDLRFCFLEVLTSLT